MQSGNFSVSLKANNARITGLNSTYCLNQAPVTLTGIPAGGIFTGKGVSGNVFNPTTAGIGTHTITYKGSQNGCEYEATQSVTVNPIPVSQIIGLQEQYCLNHQSIPLTATPLGGEFLINGQPTTSLNPKTLGVGNYTIVYQGSLNNCSYRKVQSLKIIDTTAAAIRFLESEYCQIASPDYVQGLRYYIYKLDFFCK